MKLLRFGIELEMFPGEDAEEDYDGDRVDEAIAYMRRAGLCSASYQHPYHCHCEECTYARSGALFVPQSDCTVGIEFVSRILSTRSNGDLQDLLTLRSVYPEILDATRWEPDGYVNAGNHIHVSHPAIDASPSWMKAKAAAYINALMATNHDAWEDIADGGCGRLRSYNSAPSPTGFSTRDWCGESGWTRERDHTIEVRVWNTPVDPDRLLMHPAISVGLVQWAFREAEIDDAASASQVFDSVANDAQTHHKRLARSIRETWPHKNSAARAAELVTAW